MGGREGVQANPLNPLWICHWLSYLSNLCRVYNIGIDVMQGKGQFRNTNIVTFAPRYEIDNQSGHKLAISQRHFTSKEVSWPQVLHAGKFSYFFFVSADKLASSVACWENFQNFFCRLLISWLQV